MSRPASFSLLAVVAVAVIAADPRAQCGLEATAGDPIAHLQGSVDAVTTWDPDGAGPLPQYLVAAGSFDVGSTPDRHVVMWNGTAWVDMNEPFVLPSLPPPVPPSPPALTTWNGNLIVHFASDVWSFDGSSWTLLGSPRGVFNTFGKVNALAVYNGELVVAGNFILVEVPSQPLVYVTNIAKWNGSTWSGLGGGLTLPFTTTVTGNCAAVFNNSLWIAVTTINYFPPTQASGGIHVWNGTAWTSVGVFDGPVVTLATRIGTALTNSFLFAGGSFTSVSGTASPIVARFSPSTNSWTAIGPPPTQGATSNCQQLFVRSIGISSYELAGMFSTSGADKTWTRTGSTWTPLPALVDEESVWTARLGYHGGRYVVGVHCSPETASRGLRAHDTATGTWQPLHGAGIRGIVRAVCHDGPQLVIGGDFTNVSGTVVHCVARGSANGWQPLGSGFAGSVWALVRMPNGDLVAGGNFTALGDSTPMNRIARWNGAAWTAIGGGVDGSVRALAVAPNGDLVAGGSFTLAGGQAASRIARWNGTSWQALGTGCNDVVHALVWLGNGDLVAGGAFTAAGGQAANRVARWNGASWSAIGAGLDDTVYALTQSNDGIVAGGAFSFSGVYPTAHLARWDGTGTTWYPFGTFDQPDRPIFALATLPGGETAIGGQSFVVSGGARTGAAVWRNGAWQSLWVDGASVQSLAMGDGGSLAMGGEFGLAEGVVSGNVARVVSSCPASVANAAPGCPSSGGANTLAAVTMPWLNAALRTRAVGVPTNAIVLVLTGFTVVAPGLPLAALLPQGVPGCEVRVASDTLQLTVATSGAAQAELFLPNMPSLVGTWFYQQMLPLEFNAQGTWVAITATNSIELSPGVF